MDTGKNIFNAFKVVNETHHSIDKLIKYCSCVEGVKFKLLSPKFLRYKSDPNYYGWNIASFILLFTEKRNHEQDGIEKTNDVYVLEICPFDENKLYGNVTDEESILILSRFIYKQRNKQIKNCSPADHWRFYWPLRKSDMLFKFDSSQDVYIGSINPTTDHIKFSRDYWDVQKIVTTKLPLVSITGDNAKEKIFETFERLSMTEVEG